MVGRSNDWRLFSKKIFVPRVVSSSVSSPLYSSQTWRSETIILITLSILVIMIITIIMVILIIMITRPKPPSGRQGLAGLWGKDTVRQVHYKMFSTSHFAPTALSSNWILLFKCGYKNSLVITQIFYFLLSTF